jgi:uncharacterized protein (DUF2384 family)
MASGYMVDLFGASAEADDYLVKTESVLDQFQYQSKDNSDQSLSHRSEGVSEELLISGVECLVYRWLRGHIIIKQRSKRQWHSEHSGGRTDHFNNLSADNGERLLAVAQIHSGTVKAVDTEDGDSFVCSLST